MKWKILLASLVLAVSSTFAVAGEETVDNLSQQARVSSEPVDLSNFNYFSIGKNDANMRSLLFICTVCLTNDATASYAKGAFDYDVSEQTFSPSVIDPIIQSGIINLSLFAGTLILLFLGKYVFTKMVKKGGDAFGGKTVWLILLIGSIAQPKIFFMIVGMIWVTLIAALNYFQRSLDTVALNSDSANDTEKGIFQPQETLSYYDTSEGNFIWNAYVENKTRSALIYTHNIQLGRDGWFNTRSNITKGEVLKNIENTVSLEVIPQYKDGVVNRADFRWRENTEEYNKRQFGGATVLFSVEGSHDDAQIESLDSTFLLDVKKQGEADGAAAFSADSIYSNLKRLEGIALDKIKAGDDRAVESYYDQTIANAASEALQNGALAILNRYKSEGLSSRELEALYRAYGNQFLKSANGLNPELTVLGKWKYAQEAQVFVDIYNASQFWKKNEFNVKQINMFNMMGSGQEWADMNVLTASINYQWVTLIGGVLRFSGLNPETDQQTIDNNRQLITASNAALNLFKSNVVQGVDNGQRIFSGRYNSYKNDIVANWDKGAFMSAALNTVNLGKVMNGALILSASTRNAVTVGRVTAENDVGIDLVKLFGGDISKDATNDERYKYFTDTYEPIVFDQIASAKQAANIKSHEQAKTATGETGLGDMFVNYMQNNSTILSNFKQDTGLPQHLSITDGMRYCQSNSTECDRRGTGTISSIYRSDVLMFGIQTKVAVVAIKALDSLGDALEGSSFSGVVKLINNLPVVGWIMKVVGGLVKLLAIFAAVLDVIANMFILLGVWSMVLQFLPTIQALIQQAMMPMAVIEFIFLIVGYAFLAAIHAEPRRFYHGLKAAVSLIAGLFFFIFGFYTMLSIIYMFPTQSVQRSIYIMFSGDGGVIGVLVGFIAQFIGLCLIHSAAMLTVKMVMDLKGRIFGDDQSYASDMSTGQVESLAITYVAEKGVISIGNKTFEAVNKDGAVKRLLDTTKKRFGMKTKTNSSSHPPKSNETQTEGV